MSGITPQILNSQVDFYNSSNTPLGISGVFTGTGIDILNYAIIAVTIATDQDSATDGLSLQQSSNGTDWDHTDDYTILAGRHKVFTLNPVCQYFRIVYTNGSVAQTYMRLQVLLKAVNIKPSSHKTINDITTEDDAELVKSILMTKANNLNDFKNIEFNNPMPINGDQLYPHDINLTYSDMHDFSGSPIDLTDNRWSIVTDTTATNPKLLDLEFERPIQTTLIGLFTDSGSFSNTVIKYGLTGTGDTTLLDESTDSTAKQYLLAPTAPINLSYLHIEFHTANTITLSSINIAKLRQGISQIQGIDNDGHLINFGATHRGNFKISVQEYGDTSSIDAFNRLRVSEPFTIFDSKQLHDKQTLFWDESVGGSATSSHSNAYCNMAVTASASDFVIRQTKQRFNYQPGKSQLILSTFYAPTDTGVTQRIGVFDGTGANYLTPLNGIYFENDAGTLSFNVAKNGTVTETFTQANWNVDIFDGSGVSGIDLDMEACQILIIDFEALMVGRIRCGFVVNGIIHYCLYINHANDNNFTTPYFDTPNLSLRYDIVSDGSSTGNLYHICSTVMSEGGLQQTGIIRGVDMGVTHLDADSAGTSYAAIGIRLKSTYYDITAIPERFSIISLTNDNFRWRLVLNPTVAGTFTYNDLADSSIQYATGATANTVTGGTVIDSGYGQSQSVTDRQFLTALHLGSTISGVQDTIVLTITPYTSNADYLASLTVREYL